LSHILIIITGAIYSYISFEQFYLGNNGMGICYFGYALGNVGLYMMAK
jgi:TM2 domain-containing membrane protein YozV